MLTQDSILKFKNFCEERGWDFDKRFTSEFTFQFRLCRFLDVFFQDRYNTELESSINRYQINNLVKKVIDIDLMDKRSNKRHAIEIKYLRDEGSYDVGMFEICKDIKFLEQLRTCNFSTCFSLVFTTVSKIHTPIKLQKAKILSNLQLYNCFGKNFQITGNISLQTGKREVQIEGQYQLKWFDFSQTIKACLITV